MGILERKEREKQEMRERILHTASQMFLEEGYDKTSIRGIAERIEYSPAAIYLYFKDKNEIFVAIHDRAFDLLFSKLAQANLEANPFARLCHMGGLFVGFALENPELYDLMFIMREPMDALCQREMDWDKGFRSFNFLRETLRECMEAGLMKPMDLDVAAVSVFSFVHGVTSLIIRGRFKMYPAEQHQALVEQSLQNMLELMRA
ncbi:MAG: TetR/AcrR family transcriptional regulator [Bernardetiaceae bacterium]|jgi:AcrR family transcriptional regulator|nr:TetR/AcrR family transcriptional regulator [Bernardetiaceae bacterium]